MTFDSILKYCGMFFLLWICVVVLWLIYEKIKNYIIELGAIGYRKEKLKYEGERPYILKSERKRQRLRMRRYNESIRKALYQ
jgi:hypothetical protein